MSSTKPMLNEDLIRSLTEWTQQQLGEGIQQGKLNVRKIVCRLIREGQRTKQAQMPKGTKLLPALSPIRNTTGTVGVCPLIEKNTQLGWVAYYQNNGSQECRRFRFSEFGDAAFVKAQAWRKRGLKKSRDQRRAKSGT